MAVTPPRGARGAERALRMPVGSPLGCTEQVLLAHGFTVGMRGLLVLDGPADGGAGDRACRRAADPGDLVTISDLGRQALAGT
jgi:hypothetical protein